MSAPDLPIIEKLLATKVGRTDFGGVQAGAFHQMPINPDGPEAAEVIKSLYEALDQIDTWLRGGDGNGQELMLKAGNALSRARGEER
jgi:hypothetical protein